MEIQHQRERGDRDRQQLQEHHARAGMGTDLLLGAVHLLAAIGEHDKCGSSHGTPGSVR